MEASYQSAQVAEMPDSLASSTQLNRPSALSPGLPEVTLEVRQAAGRASSPYPFNNIDFLVGTVPGCDLRVSGAELPAVLCILARHPGGLTFRKLAPTHALLVNGKSASHCELTNGDRLTLGATDVFVKIAASAPADARPLPASSDLEARERRLQEQTEDFRRAEQQLKLDQAALLKQRDILGKPASDHADLDRQRQELNTTRQELADIRRQLYQHYQERRDRLAGLQEAVDRAARKVQENKRAFEKERQLFQQQRADVDAKLADVERRSQELAGGTRRFHEDHQRVRRELADKFAEVQAREKQLAFEKLDVDAKIKQYNADVLRIDRQQANLEERDRQLEQRARDLEDLHAKLQADSAALEQQAVELDELRTQLVDEEKRLQEQRVDHDTREAELAQRAASLEGQQATLAGLRTRFERQREELRQEQQQFEQERARHADALADCDRKYQEAMKVQAELDSNRKACADERQQLVEKRGILEGAVSQLRREQEKFALEVDEQRRRGAELEQRQTDLVAKEGVLEGRLSQLAEAQERLDAERANLRERTLALAQAEQVRENLQEQLRRRGEELAVRQKALHEQTEQFEKDRADLLARQDQVDLRDRQFQESLHASLQQFEQQRAELLEREQKLQHQSEQLREESQSLAEQRQQLEEERSRKLAADQQLRDEFAATAARAQEIIRQLPEIELRAGAGLDRLGQVREQLRDHIVEIQKFARQCQDDLEALHTQMHQDVVTFQQKEHTLRHGQEEQRRAVLTFRQQIIDWQAQLTEMKRLLAQGENRLDRRQAQVEEKAREVDATSEALARQADELEQQKRLVAEHRQEVDRHLGDMRLWYRKKLRDLAGLELDGAQGNDRSLTLASGSSAEKTRALVRVPAPGADDDSAIIPVERNILSITSPVDPGDRRLGDVLQQLELVDADSLTALLVEARRQRRSLRQVLLASGTITLYQLALIEAGELDGLMLGPVRVIDRLKTTSHEAHYHVFDPQRGVEALLRHLAEDEAADARRADEYRAAFRQASIDHPNLAATLEVLDIAERPAVLQEWLVGLPSTDWPPLAAVPGVCFRLLQQAAGALTAAHAAGLVHGHLDENFMVLTADGTLKVCGFGEPPWLCGSGEPLPPRRADFQALGKVVSGWCTTTGVRRGAKAKPLPAELVSVLFRLAADGAQGYTDATELVRDLDKIASAIPANPEAWDRLLRHIKDHATPEALLRQSA